MTDMLDDVFVDHLIAEYGPAGFGIWCGVLETYAKYAKDNCGDFVQIPWSALTNRLRTSSAKIQRLLNDCEAAGKLSQRTNPKCLEIKIPKMVDLRDEWRRKKDKNSGVAPEPYTEADPDPETEKEATTPLPPSPSWQVGSGQDFKLNLRGQRLNGDEWLLRVIRQHRLSQRQSLDGCETLESVSGCYGNHMEQVNKWIRAPVTHRMAVCAYTILKAQPDSQLKYAINALSNVLSWEGLRDYLKIATEQVEKGDYEVNING